MAVTYNSAFLIVDSDPNLDTSIQGDQKQTIAYFDDGTNSPVIYYFDDTQSAGEKWLSFCNLSAGVTSGPTLPTFDADLHCKGQEFVKLNEHLHVLETYTSNGTAWVKAFDNHPATLTASTLTTFSGTDHPVGTEFIVNDGAGTLENYISDGETGWILTSCCRPHPEVGSAISTTPPTFDSAVHVKGYVYITVYENGRTGDAHISNGSQWLLMSEEGAAPQVGTSLPTAGSSTTPPGTVFIVQDGNGDTVSTHVSGGGSEYGTWLTTAEVSNSDLSVTESNTTNIITSSDGTNATLTAASTSKAGLMTKAIFDEHVLNNAKVSNVAETVTSISVAANVITYTDEDGNDTTIDLSTYLDDTNLARLTSGSLNGTTGIATFTRDDASTFTIDMSAFLDAITLNNTLTSTSTTEGLTAAQGKVLKDLIDALPTSDTVDMGSGFKIANSAGTDQFTVVEDEEIRFEGSGATSVTFDASTQKVTISSTDNNTDTIYTHPTHPGDDASIDTGALTGATVISDLDLNITTDTLGHVTDANATVSTRALTLADLGFTGDADATSGGKFVDGTDTDDAVYTTGNVGIGTNDPGHILDVQAVTDPSIRVRSSGTGASDDALVRIRIGGTTASSIVAFGDSASSTRGQIKYTHSVDALRLYTSGTEQVRIDSSGDVGIGNTSPENILHVEKANPIILVQDTDTSLSTTEAYIKFSGSQSSAAGGGFRTDIEKAIGYKEDSLVFEDGGTERMRIDSSGNVGIGTDDPSSRLEVSDSDPTIRLTNSTVSLGNGTVGSFEFFTEDSSTNASRVLSSIDCENAAGSSIPGGELVFKTSLGGGSFTQATEKMRLDDVGNLGIGTDDPDALLHISQGANSTATNLIIENTDTSIVDTEDLAKIEFKSNDISTEGVGVAASIRTVAESAGNRFGIAFNTKNLSAETEKMRIAYTGNVGIGFTVPADKLEVGGAISASAGYGFKLANSTETAIGKWYSASGVNYLEGDGTRSFQIGSSTNGVNVKFDNVNNRVGIGNESPDATLAIGDSTSTGNYIKVEGSSSDNTYTVFEGKRKYPKIRLEDTIGSAFELWNLGNTLRFGTSVGNAGSAAWYTKSGVAGDVIFNGDVGIGTSSPGSKLEVNGSVEFNQDGDVMFYAGDGSSNFNWGIGDFDQAGGGASIKNNVGEVEVHTDGSIAATFRDDNRISGVADPLGAQDVSTKKYVDDLKVAISIAVSDEETDLAVGTSNVTFRMPYAMTLTEVRASLNRAPGGSTLIVDINDTASTVLSTKLSIDIGEKTSTTAATAAVISDTALADDAEITIDIDQIGSSDAGKGLKVTLIGTRAIAV